MSKAKGPRPNTRVLVVTDNHDVASMVRFSGAEAVSLGNYPQLQEAIDTLAECHALVITGGGDVNPRLYGATPHGQTQSPTAGRDYRELTLLGAARDMGIPVLGICRGMQVIAVEAGGTLYQHIPDKVKHSHHDCSMMNVETVEGSLVHRTLGEWPDMMHLHHQAVKRVPDGFQVTAKDPWDNTIEAIESLDGRVVAVQFHPELDWGPASVYDYDPTSSRIRASAGNVGAALFDAFVRTARRYQRRSKAHGVKPLKRAHEYASRWPIARETYYHYTAPKAQFGTVYKMTDKRTGVTSDARVLDNGKLVPASDETRKRMLAICPAPADETDRLMGTTDSTITIPVAWCGDCLGMAFDNREDYDDHMDYFHPVSLNVPAVGVKVRV